MLLAPYINTVVSSFFVYSHSPDGATFDAAIVELLLPLCVLCSVQR